MVAMKFDASRSESWVPVSSHATPRPSCLTFNLPSARYSLFRSVISSSPRADGLSDLSPYYLVKKDNLKLLVNIKDWTLIVIELPSNTNDKKFIYGKNKFKNCGLLKLNK